MKNKTTFVGWMQQGCCHLEACNPQVHSESGFTELPLILGLVEFNGYCPVLPLQGTRTPPLLPLVSASPQQLHPKVLLRLPRPRQEDYTCKSPQPAAQGGGREGKEGPAPLPRAFPGSSTAKYR